MIRTAILIAALAAALPASADTVGIHLVSKHFATDKPKNDANWGVYWRSDDGITAGAYCNSYSLPGVYKGASNCDVTKYAGKTWLHEFTGPFGLSMDAGGSLALAHGYGRRLALFTVGGAHLTVMPLPTVRLGAVRLTGIGYRGMHLSVEHNF